MSDWRAKAACKGMPTELYYDEETRGGALPAIYEVLSQLCEGCPVKSQCLEWALQSEMYGYFAGTTALVRKAMRKELDIKVHDPASIFEGAQCGTPAGYARHRRRVQAGLEERVTCVSCKRANLIKSEENKSRNLRRA